MIACNFKFVWKSSHKRPMLLIFPPQPYFPSVSRSTAFSSTKTLREQPSSNFVFWCQDVKHVPSLEGHLQKFSMQLGNFSKDFLKTESMALELIYFSQNCFLHLSKSFLLRVLYITNITWVKFKKRSIQLPVNMKYGTSLQKVQVKSLNIYAYYKYYSGPRSYFSSLSLIQN